MHPNTSKTDEDIALDVTRALAGQPGLREAAIQPLVHGGHVNLCGTVAAWHEIGDAARVARLVPGVKRVTASLAVEPPQNERRTDEELAAVAAESLKRSCMTVPPGTICANVACGVATLEGKVVYMSQRYDAERAMERLRGLRGLSNAIRVVPAEHIDPEVIRMVVTNALRGHALQDALGVAISADGGTLRVKGELHSLQEKRDVLAAVRAAPGVRGVVDELTLRREPGDI